MYTGSYSSELLQISKYSNRHDVTEVVHLRNFADLMTQAIPIRSKPGGCNAGTIRNISAGTNVHFCTGSVETNFRFQRAKVVLYLLQIRDLLYTYS